MKVLPGPFKNKFYASWGETNKTWVKYMHFPHLEIKFSYVMTKVYLLNEAFRNSGAQNGSCLFREGNYEADNNLIAGKILNLFL